MPSNNANPPRIKNCEKQRNEKEKVGRSVNKNGPILGTVIFML